MAYTKHSWREKAGSTGAGGDRETWLNHAETQYDEVVTYYTTTLHDDSYYTEAECDAKFFSASTDGTGSGFVAETLDGVTAVELINSQVAVGSVIIWSGSEASIPAGWQLCDGTNGTPDLQNVFPVACGSSYAWKDTGGAKHVTPYSSSITIGNTTLTETHLPAHTHSGLLDYKNNITAGAKSFTGAPGIETQVWSYTGYAGSGGSHTHTGSYITDGQGGAENNMPYYKAYCYIMKV